MNPCINLNAEPPPQENSPIHQQSINQPEALGGVAMEVISRIYSENKKMTHMVADIFEKYSSLNSQLMQYLITSTNDPENRKRTADHLEINRDDNINNNNNKNDVNVDGHDPRSCCKRLKMINFKPEVARVLVRVDSSDSSLAVKDGYQWRKYGQKVTRDNPSPRAYFKCSFAPLCPVKKKVQRSVGDPMVLVVTYEGEHTHKKPPTHGASPTLSTIIPSINLGSSRGYISSPDRLILQNLRDTNHKDKGSEEETMDDQDESLVKHWLVEQMASSLTKDPSFTSTLAAAISDRVLEHTFC